MSLKKQVLYKALFTVARQGITKTGWFKKFLIAVIVLGVVFVISAGILLYFTVSTVSRLLADKPDIDLIALEYLVSAQTIVLTSEQQTLFNTITIEMSGLDPQNEQIMTLKTELWNTLDQYQLQAVNEWQAQRVEAGETLFGLPPAVLIFIEKHTGITAQQIQNKVDDLRLWWQRQKSDYTTPEPKTPVPAEQQRRIPGSI